ncbi:hypothetical protein MMA231_02470 [Asticcacaulis sp. MM231]
MSSDETVPIPYDARRQARSLYWRGWGVTEIADELQLKRTTVQSWCDRDKWADAPMMQRIEECVATKLMTIVSKDKYTGSDVRDIDLLTRQAVNIEIAKTKVRRYEQPDGHEGDLNEKVANRNAGPKKKPTKNLLDMAACEKLRAAFEEGAYAFQQTWWDNQGERIRMLLKSRQIGATYSFARERLIRALVTGNNQIFISASRNQANVFRQYIVQFVEKETGITLKGNPLVIDRGTDADGNYLEPVELHFLGTNYRTAQSYHGDVIIDEFFWIYGFEQLYKVASAMATQKRYTITLFSTPSTVAHEAYPMWTGERYNRKRKKGDRINLDVSHEALKNGASGADRIWRQIVTLDDAIEGGYDLIDRDELQLEYSVEEFDNLFNCLFVDDSASTFPMSILRPCMVDSYEVWQDVKVHHAKPYAGEVWLGYDPAESADGDNASLIALAAPNGKTGKFRAIEKKQLKGMSYQKQAELIAEWTRKYNVTEIAIDVTGMGGAVWQLVSGFFPRARRIQYSPSVKADMVYKAKNVIENDRLEFDAGWSDLAMAMMSIHAKLTKGGHQITYVARRSAATGHGDLAWALLHALYCEPLEGADGAKKSTVEFSDDDEEISEGRSHSGYGHRSERISARRGRGVQLRRRGIGARPPRVAPAYRVLAQRALLRAAGRSAHAGARGQCGFASSLRLAG